MSVHSTSAPLADAASTPQQASSSRRRVIDAPTRMFHGLFAFCFIGAYLTGDGERWRLVHVTLGYTMAGLFVFRILYGLIGPRHARLGMLWRKLAAAPAWLGSLRDSSSLATINWRQGQNLVMALAVFALLALVLPLTLSGYGTYNDWGEFLGGDVLEELHEFFAEAFLSLVLVHLTLILGLSLLRQKNQAAPMLSGYAQGAGPSLIKKNHGWLAALLLALVLSFWVWQWQQSPTAAAATTTTHQQPSSARRA